MSTKTKYQVEAGRLITRNNEPIISIHRQGCNPVEADALAHFVADALNAGDFEVYLRDYKAK